MSRGLGIEILSRNEEIKTGIDTKRNEGNNAWLLFHMSLVKWDFKERYGLFFFFFFFCKIEVSELRKIILLGLFL